MQEQQVQDFFQMMRREWEAMVAREGAVAAGPAPVDPEAEPPCPACGNTDPLVDGACSDCGLQLA